jgi:SNF2 family DNA or RNA helicase
MWSVFDFLMPGHLSTYQRFVERFEAPILAGELGANENLASRVRPFMLRRLKKDVAKDLPEKIRFDEWTTLQTPEQADLYGEIQEEAKHLQDGWLNGQELNQMNILTVITKLKQICVHPVLLMNHDETVMRRSNKFDWCVEKIEEIVSTGEKVVIFTEYLGSLDLFESALSDLRISYVRIDGSTQGRQELVDQFNQGSPMVALCSLKACSHGITMTAANHVIHVSRWWNPAVEEQATDRVHRIGQERTVYVYNIQVENTLEERIADILERKRDLVDGIMGTDSWTPEKMTREELLEILKPF